MARSPSSYGPDFHQSYGSTSFTEDRRRLTTSFRSDPCLERQFATHTQWLQLLATEPAFLARLDAQDLAQLSDLLSRAKQAVDLAGTNGQVHMCGSCTRLGSAWDSLPPGVASLIFNKLSVEAAASARLACLRWSRQICGCWYNLKPHSQPPKSWASTFSSLQSLDLRRCRGYHLTKEDARNLTDLKELRLAGTACTEELQALRALKSLTALNISRCYDVRICRRLGERGLCMMERCEHMMFADYGCLAEQVTDAGVESLAPLTQLSILNLSSCFAVRCFVKTSCIFCPNPICKACRSLTCPLLCAAYRQRPDCAPAPQSSHFLGHQRLL